MTRQLAALLAPEWASFPTLRGVSYYGQPVKRFDRLRFLQRFIGAAASVRDQRRQQLAEEAAPSDDSPKGPVQAPTILCGF